MAQRIRNPRGNPANLRPPWRPGESGNPAGRPTAGATMREWLNALSAAKPTDKQLHEMIGNGRVDPNKRAAAIRYLAMITPPDVSVFEPWISGEKTFSQLKAEGAPVHLVESFACKPIYSKRGELLGYARSLKLRDRTGEEFDRICDHTAGRPRQAIEVSAEVPVAVEIVTPMSQHATGNDRG